MRHITITLLGYGEIKGETFPDDDFVDQGTVHCTQKMLVMVVFVRTLMYFSGESTQCQCIFHVFATLYLHSCSLVNYLILFCSTFILQDMDTLANTTTIHNNLNRNYHHITVNSISESCNNYIVQQKCHISICSNMTNKAFIFKRELKLLALLHL